MMIVLNDYLEPNEYIDYYVRNPGAFTLSLSSVIESKILGRSLESPLLNVEEFIKATELEPLRPLLNQVSTSLYSHETKVISLTQEMGFGKTHALIFLWMIYADVPKKYNELISDPYLGDVVRELRDKYRVGVVKNLFILPIDMNTIVGADDPYEELIEIVKRSISENILFTGNPLNDARKVMEYVSNEGGKLLVLVDELYHGAIKTYDNKQILTSFINIMKFLIHLIDENERLKIPLVVVYSSANQDVSRWMVDIKNRADANLRNVMDVFIDRAERVGVTGLPYVTPEGIIRILTKRLLKIKPPGRDKALSIVLKSVPELPFFDVDSYRRRLERSFPFTPDFLMFIEKLMKPKENGDLSRSQHLRSLLKIVSKLIKDTFNRDLWSKISLIPLGFLRFDDIKELIRESLENHWRTVYNSGQRTISDMDEIKRSMFALIHSSIFSVSMTDSLYKIYGMITGTIAEDELRVTSISESRIIDPIFGAVQELDIDTLVEIIEDLKRHVIPFIQVFERGGDTYFYTSIIPDPRQIVDSIRESEIRKLFTLGEPDRDKMMSYLSDFLTSERFYEILYSAAERNEINLEIVDPDKLSAKDELIKIIKRLPRDKFSIIIPKLAISNIDSRELVDVLDKVVNDIPAPNLFSIVLLKLDDSLLYDICAGIATLNAYKLALEMQKVDGASRVAERTGIRRVIEPLREEADDKLIKELMEAVQKTVDRYIKMMIGSSVTSLTHKLASIFQETVYLDPKEERFVRDKLDLVVSNDNRDKICILVAETVIKKTLSVCNVKYDREELSDLIRNYIRDIALGNKELLIRNGELKIEGKEIITNLIKGWRELPIKTKNISIIKNSVFPALSGKPLRASDPLLIDAKIRLVTDTDTITIYIPERRIIRHRSETETRIEREKYHRGIQAVGDTNVSICLHNVNRVAKKFGVDYKITLSLKLGDGTINLSNASDAFISKIFGSFDDFLSILDDLRHQIENIQVEIYFGNPLRRKELEKYFGTADVKYL